MIVNCAICDIPVKTKPSKMKSLKGGKITCSRECSAKLRSIVMKGEGNHQYGLIGDKNASFKNEDTISNYGYVLEYCPGHPRPHDKSNKGVRVKQHRLVIERNHEMFDNTYFEKIDNWIVLKSEYHVHHINEIKTDNRLENLQITTKSEHTILHNKQKEIIRDSTNGRIIGVLKLGEFMETPEVDNHEPSIDLNVQ